MGKIQDLYLSYISSKAVVQTREESFRAGYMAGRLEDNPEMDGTDFAHPAWLRGEEYATRVLCKQVNDILDGTVNNVGVASNPWQPLRQRLYDIRTLLDIAESVVDIAHAFGFAKINVTQWHKVRRDYAERLKSLGYCGKCGDSIPECKCPPKEKTK